MRISPWSDVGWVADDTPVKRSPCHNAQVDFSRGDGVSMGTCAQCEKAPAPDLVLDSPNFVPKELEEFAARGYERKDRHAPDLVGELVEALSELLDDYMLFLGDGVTVENEPDLVTRVRAALARSKEQGR